MSTLDLAPQRDRARTRDRILASAEDLLTSTSARDIKVRDIAQRAGVSASLVVQYFASKDALVLDVGLRRLGAPPPPAPVEGGIAAIVRWMAAFDAAHKDLFREMMRQTWWFGAAEEAALDRAFAPRIEAFRAALGGVSFDQGDALLRAYLESLRKSFVSKRTGEDLVKAATSAVKAASELIHSQP